MNVGTWFFVVMIPRVFVKDETLNDEQMKTLEKDATRWRERLADLSWYMRVLNERIAREATWEEDEYTGCFWQGRYESKALLDDKVLTGMIYVDLNPVRAGIADTPETSLYTSIKKRLDAEMKGQAQPEYLLPFNGPNACEGLPFDRLALLSTLDWTSRKVRQVKASAVASEPELLLTRIGIDEHHWMIDDNNILKVNLKDSLELQTNYARLVSNLIILTAQVFVHVKKR